MLGPLLGIGTAVIFATASIFSRRGLEEAPFDVLLLVSLAVGAPIFLVSAALTTGFADTPPIAAAYVAASAVLGSVIARGLYFLGIEFVGPGKSLSVSATQPLYVALIAAVVLGEALTPAVVVGVLALAFGVVAISRDARAETERTDRSLLVMLIPALGAVIAALGAILRKLALTIGIAPIEAGAVNMVVGLAVVAPVVLARQRRRPDPVGRAALRNFAIASLLMAIGFFGYFFGLRITNASVFIPLTQTQPLWAVALSALFLRNLEIVTRYTAVGASLVVIGAALVVLG